MIIYTQVTFSHFLISIAQKIFLLLASDFIIKKPYLLDKVYLFGGLF